MTHPTILYFTIKLISYVYLLLSGRAVDACPVEALAINNFMNQDRFIGYQLWIEKMRTNDAR